MLGIKEKDLNRWLRYLGKSPMDFKLQFRVKNRMLILAVSGRQLSGILGFARNRLHTNLTRLISETGNLTEIWEVVYAWLYPEAGQKIVLGHPPSLAVYR